MIDIIDGFYLGKSTPIDSRIVASGSVARNAIDYKYEGMRVFDTSDGVAYVWWNNTWVGENTGSVTSGAITNYVPKMTSSNVLGDSIIYENAGKIGIGNTGPAHTLDVNGNICGSNIIGTGSSLTALDASKITLGSLALSRLANGGANYILSGGSPNPVYRNPQDVTVGKSDNSYIANVTDNTAYYPIFATGSNSYTPLKANSAKFRFNPYYGQLYLSEGNSAARPTLAVGYTTTGFYRYGTNGLSITTGAGERASFNEDGSRLIKSSIESLGDFYITNGTNANETLLSIISKNYDRTLYFYNIFNASYTISSGNAKISILIGSAQIYSKLITSTYSNLYDCNYNFILPAGLTLTVKCDKSIFSWNSGSGVQFFIKGFRFGLNGFDD